MIAVCDMKTSHIENSMIYIRTHPNMFDYFRWYWWIDGLDTDWEREDWYDDREYWINVFIRELIRRKDFDFLFSFVEKYETD